ncbi:MAG: serine/threonine protein kinase [Phycisphaerales bacterium]|nr:serine/threonine protein kinase [Phycisphaerales bacterium]
MSEPVDGDQSWFQRVESVFVEVCDLSGDERESRLDELCGGEAELRRSVLTLLSADDIGCPVLDPGAIAHLGGIEDESSDEIPETIGSFRIVRVLGEGGMGVVYEAIQQTPRRHIALKVIRHRAMHAQIRRRFEMEADILARLNHPGIATVYESGVAEDVRGATPYVAMELVDGVPITAYAREHCSGTDERVALLREVCRAVGYAHSVGVIHRDLKPSNILVDKRGRVKVLDFGIALDMQIEQRTQMTSEGQMLGTLQYMAPEQVDSRAGGSKTETDVYALGLVSYEVLTGESPVARHGSSMYELVRAIRDEDIGLLGTHSRALRGDLETILAKALEKDIDRRYADAGAFGEDLDRYLEHKPIEARRASTWYQLRKFSERNPALVGSFAAVMVVLLVAVVVISNALRVATRERRIAEHDQQVKEMVNGFMTEDLFQAADPSQGGDPQITLVDAMLRASEGVGERFGDAPEVEAEVRHLMGDQFDLMGRFPEALAHAKRSVELSESLGLPIDTIIMRRNLLCQVYSDLNEMDLALACVTETKRLAETRDGVSDEQRFWTMMEQASLLFHLDQVERSAEIFEEAVAFGSERLPDHDAYQGAVADLALVYTRLGRFEDAERMYAQSIAYSTEKHGADNSDTLVIRDNLGLLYLKMDRAEDAVTQLNEVLRDRIRVFGEEHSKTYITRSTLGRALMELGRYDEAEAQLLEAYEGIERFYGAAHRYTRFTMNHLHDLYTRMGRDDLAAPFAAQEDP